MRKAFLLLACMAVAGLDGAKAGEEWTLSLQADDWSILFSPGMPDHPTNGENGWTFKFPLYKGRLPCEEFCPSVGYVLTRARRPLTGRSIIATVEISGAAKFEYRLESENTCSGEAAVRLFIQRRGDDLTKDSHRWWSNPDAIPLTIGEYVLAVPLEPAQWSNVAGHRGSMAPEVFYDALENVENIGLTFGGGCFFGHGVNISEGQSTFTLRQYAISR